MFIPLHPQYGTSSVGRALVSKTRCREFEPLVPCREGVFSDFIIRKDFFYILMSHNRKREKLIFY